MFSMLITIGLITFGLMIIDKIHFLLGATIWSLISYLSTKYLLKNILGIGFFEEEESLHNQPPQDHTFAQGPIPSKVYTFFEKYFPTNALKKVLFSNNSLYFNSIVSETSTNSYCGDKYSHNEEIKTYVHKISREYIHVWYKEVSDQPEFVKEIDFLLEDVLTNICNCLSKVNKHELIHKSLLLYSNHFEHYLKALENAHQKIGIKIKNETMGKIPTLKSEYEGVHPALEDEWRYARAVVATAIDLLGPVDMLDSPLPRRLVEEVLAHNVLMPLVALLSDPAWINRVIVLLLGDSSSPVASQPVAPPTSLMLPASEDLPPTPVVDKVWRQVWEDPRSKTLSSTPRHEARPRSHLDLKRSRSMDFIRPGPAEDIEEAEEAMECPRLFSNILIINTETVTSAKDPYTIYCIQYDGLFSSLSPGEPRFVTKTIVVKRRFREFLTLQSRLEDNPTLKKHLKGVKGPSRWLSRPGSSTDHRSVQERRVFLQHYLQNLCHRSVLASSPELQEFLAYGSDARLAYVNRKTAREFPRIDKMLVRGVIGAFDRIRTALPTLPQDPLLDMVNYGDKLGSFRRRSEVPELGFDQESLLDTHISHFLNNFSFSWSLDSLEELSMLPAGFTLPSSSSSQSHRAVMPASPLSGRLLAIHDDIPLGSTLIDLVFQAAPLHDLHLVLTCKLLAGKYLDRLVEQGVEELLTYDRCVEWLHLLHLKLWPPTSACLPTSQSPDDIRLHALALLNSYLPEVLRRFWGPHLESSCRLLLDSLQYPPLNKSLVYQLVDLIVETVLALETRS